MDYKSFFQSKIFKGILYVIGALIIALLVFQAGMFMGYRRAGFSYKWGEHYYRNFGGYREYLRGEDRDGFGIMGMMRENFLDSNGVTGKIIKIELPNVMVLDEDGTEKIVVVDDDTAIRSFMYSVKSTDLKVDDFIVVIGSPNDQSQINAKLIRVMPEPPVFQSKTKK